MKTRTRVQYLDITKALLIVMVVWGHFSLMENMCYKIYNPYTTIISDLKLYWEAFFMPAFFIISGLLQFL